MFKILPKTVFLALSFICVPVLTVFIMSGMAENFSLAILAAILFIIVFGFALYKRKKQFAAGMLVFGALMFCAFVSCTFSYNSEVKYANQVVNELGETEHIFYGFLEKEDSYSSGRLFVKIVSVDAIKLKNDVGAYAINTSGHFLHEGAYLKLTARLRSFESENTAFDMENWLYGKGVYCEMYDITGLEPDYSFDTVSVGSYLRNLLFDKVIDVLNYVKGKESFERSVALCKALLFGDKSGFDSDSLENFSKSGMTHLLCVSGLHFSIFTGCLSILLRFVIPGKNIRIAVVVALAFLYLAMCDFSLSAIRAAVMSVISGIGVACGKKHSCTHSLLLAVTVICIISPYSIFDMGFRLSVLSCAGIACSQFVTDVITERFLWNRVLCSLINCFMLSASSFVFTSVYLACATGGLSLVSPVTSIFAVTPAQICMILAWLSLFAAIFKIDILCFSFAKAISVLSDYLYSLASYFSGLKYSYIRVDFPDLSLAVFISVIIAISFASVSRANGAKIYFYVSLSSLISVILILCCCNL